MTQQPFFTTLKGRALLKISGIERKSFLQGLITNDLNALDHTPYIYSCLLSPQGKFLFDFFIQEKEGVLILDCEGGERAQSLNKILNMYKLRSEAEITLEDNVPVYAIMSADFGYQDPRHVDMGYRSYEKPKDIAEGHWHDWDMKRISRTIPDGSRDMVPNKSTMDEARIDQLNGLSYEKGCYVGQELTARMHYRGLGKKHLYTISLNTFGFDAFPEHGSAIQHDGKNIGEMRSSCGETGIALLKDNIAKTLFQMTGT